MNKKEAEFLPGSIVQNALLGGDVVEPVLSQTTSLLILGAAAAVMLAVGVWRYVRAEV